MKIFLFTFLFMTSMMSCNKEELFVEPEVEVVEEDTEDTDDTDTTTTPTAVDPTLPCDFTLSSVQANSTVIINCVMDLEGETINLPENVTIVYEGGDIINGTLNFSEGSHIDGDILNSTLTIGGTTPLLRDPVFNFIPERWGIVEGEVTDEIALKNKEILKAIIIEAKEMGITTFFIDNIDAYFNVSPTTVFNRHDKGASILIPSDFHFKMGNNCNLRVQPNGFPYTVLLMSRLTENVKISGGKLWGDRYTHDYTSSGSRHEWGHVIMLRGVHNGVVDGVEMREGSGDGLDIGGIGHRNNDGSLKPEGGESYNLTIKNCIIDDNRRNNISLTDGRNIFIEYNTIKNSGSGDNSPGVSSNGTSPRSGIDIEAFKNNSPDNNSVYDWELTDNIHIRYNIFEENYAVDVALYNGENTYVYGNTFRSERAVSSAYSYNNKIYDNSFERPEGLLNGQAISLLPRYWANGNDRVIDFEVYNNTFKGYKFGVIVGGKGHKFYDNTFTDCQRGFTLLVSEDLELDNNTILSSINASSGYDTYATEASIKNCIIKNGETSVHGPGLNLNLKNNIETGSITVDNVDFDGFIRLNSANNVTIKNSTFDDIKIINSNPVLINNN